MFTEAEFRSRSFQETAGNVLATGTAKFTWQELTIPYLILHRGHALTYIFDWSVDALRKLFLQKKVYALSCY